MTCTCSLLPQPRLVLSPMSSWGASLRKGWRSSDFFLVEDRDEDWFSKVLIALWQIPCNWQVLVPHVLAVDEKMRRFSSQTSPFPMPRFINLVPFSFGKKAAAWNIVLRFYMASLLGHRQVCVHYTCLRFKVHVACKNQLGFSSLVKALRSVLWILQSSQGCLPWLPCLVRKMKALEMAGRRGIPESGSAQYSVFSCLVERSYGILTPKSTRGPALLRSANGMRPWSN